MTLSIGGVAIGGENPCRFVAEISNNHNGDFGRALRLIEAAKDAGADLVKFQCFLPEELVQLRGDGAAPYPWGEQGWSMRALYEKAQTPHAWFPKLVQHCKDVGIPWFSSVFGADSFRLLKQLENPCYKIARLDNAKEWLRELCLSESSRPILVSESESSDLEREFAQVGVWKLYCPPNYPTAPEDVRLPDAWDFDTIYIGLSSHCLAPSLPIAAVARGCKLIEMHFMLAEEPSELENEISLTQYQWRRMVQDVRECEEMLA